MRVPSLRSPASRSLLVCRPTGSTAVRRLEAEPASVRTRVRTRVLTILGHRATIHVSNLPAALFSNVSGGLPPASQHCTEAHQLASRLAFGNLSQEQSPLGGFLATAAKEAPRLRSRSDGLAGGTVSRAVARKQEVL